jgi:hypothetical protein
MEFCGSARTNGVTSEGVSYRSSHYGLADIKNQRYMEEKDTRERLLTWVACNGGETLGE